MKFKTEKQHNEFFNPLLDKRLRVITYAIDGFSRQHYSIEAWVTEVFRSPEDNTVLYTSRGFTEVPLSTHSFWRAIDLRTFIYTEEQLDKLAAFINESFEYTGMKQSALVHKVGDGVKHFHIQVDVDGETIIRK